MTSPTIRELLSYRLHQVANLLSRGAELRYRREFGVSLWEWRRSALLAAAAEPLSLTPPGKKLYRKLIGAAAERNDAFLGCLSAQERTCLEKAMTKLSREARSFIQDEKQAG